MSSLSCSTAEFRLVLSASSRVGKSPAEIVAFADVNPPNSKLWSAGLAFRPGLSAFLVRLSAPAMKWQLAHDCPSLPTCVSQKKAFPNWSTSCWSAMNGPPCASCGS